MNGRSSLPLEDFIQAMTSQLDRAQMAMALKAKAGLPLTFAVKDLSLDLRAHLDVENGAVTIRPAGPGDSDSSTLHLALTTITKPMIEENTQDLAAGEGAPSIRDVLGDDLSDEDERRLEWVGIQNVAQYRELEQSGGNRLVEKVARRPIDKLRLALETASRPQIEAVETIRTPHLNPDTGVRDLPPRLLLRGKNLLGVERRPVVRIGRDVVPIVEAGDERLLVQPLSHETAGTIEIETTEGISAFAFGGIPQPVHQVDEDGTGRPEPGDD